MKTKRLIFCCTLMSSALTAATPVLSDTHCRRVGEVSGSVKTLNMSSTEQLGTIKLVIRVKGRKYFDRQGVVVGQMKEHNPYTGEAVLDHVMLFGNGTRLDTFNDYGQAYPTGKMENGKPCEFLAEESITQALGTRKLKRISKQGTHIKASGIVSHCSDNPYNNFVLSGTVCLK